MPKQAITFATVRELGQALPGTEEGTAYGSPALKVKGRMFACIAIHRSAEPDTLAIRMSFDERDLLIAEDPETYYLTDHYVDYPVVLVRLARTNRDLLRDLLRTGWKFVSGEAKVNPRRGSRTGRR